MSITDTADRTDTAAPDSDLSDDIARQTFGPSILRTLHDHKVQTWVWKSDEDHDLPSARRVIRNWRVRIRIGPVEIEHSHRTRGDARIEADLWKRLHVDANRRGVPSAVLLAQMARFSDRVSAPRELFELVVAYREIR